MANPGAPTVHTLTSGKPSVKYHASCHCQLFRYSVTLSPGLNDLDSWVVECNCSICSRNGNLNVYVQNDCVEFEGLGLESGLVEKYRFGKQRVQHYFCSRCGSSLMAESIEPGFYEGVKALNVRMFEGIDVNMLQRREVDGRAL
ncbi:Mss4-like protein [Clohesyomyces aquaticus]|uniref:Mss4-like protein n=1 Tax=Clohesyomyces aquaticus TaxID=1231657 RepID=A0A1Y1YJG5_9PLEO|nr:Mss4-like protein [Clohesyomyces aquaticus]